MIILGPVILAQLLVITIIVFILKKILDTMLLELAIKKFTFSEFAIKLDNSQQVIIICHKEPRSSWKEMFLKLAQKKLGQNTQMIFQNDKKILGGIIIQYGNLIIDCSLLTRLKQGGFIH